MRGRAAVASFDIAGAQIKVAWDIGAPLAGKVHLKSEPLSICFDPEEIKALAACAELIWPF